VLTGMMVKKDMTAAADSGVHVLHQHYYFSNKVRATNNQERLTFKSDFY